ncbi:MAG: hypothetical protein CM15mP86_02440 [Gammaproteobacteria bacterium]|nr:MAG: hypothetical protein CM15mP86_02440 [Gammaproteobacteria bacterium]
MTESLDNPYGQGETPESGGDVEGITLLGWILEMISFA